MNEIQTLAWISFSHSTPSLQIGILKTKNENRRIWKMEKMT